MLEGAIRKPGFDWALRQPGHLVCNAAGAGYGEAENLHCESFLSQDNSLHSLITVILLGFIGVPEFE